jgi:WD40 repeat protein
MVWGSDDNVVQIWDVKIEKCEAKLEDHGKGLVGAVFSHNSKLLAYAASDYAVRI